MQKPASDSPRQSAPDRPQVAQCIRRSERLRNNQLTVYFDFNTDSEAVETFAPPEDTDEDFDTTALFNDLDDTVPVKPLVAEKHADPTLDAEPDEPTLDVQPAEFESRQAPPATEGQPDDQTENDALANLTDFATSEATIVIDAKGWPATKCVNCGRIYEKNHGIKVRMASHRPLRFF